MKKRSKKYVAHISKARSAKAALRDLAIGFVANDKGLRLVNIKHSRLERCGPSIDAALTKIRYKWTVYIAAMGRTELGKAYVKIEEIRVPHDVFKHEISSVVGKHHEMLRDTIPKSSFQMWAGWHYPFIVI